MNGFNGGTIAGSTPSTITTTSTTTGSNDVCYNILSLLQNNVCPVENGKLMQFMVFLKCGNKSNLKWGYVTNKMYL